MEILCRNEVYFHEVHFVFYDADICCPFKACENDSVFPVDDENRRCSLNIAGFILWAAV